MIRLLALLALLWATPAWAVTTTVSTASALQTAVNTAGSGDIIKVSPGNYTLSARLQITAANVTLTAEFPNNRPVITKTSEGMVEISASGATVSYLVLDNGTRRTSFWYGVVRIISGNSATISNNLIRDCYHGIQIAAGHSHNIGNNEITNCGKTNTSPENGDGHGVVNNSAGGSNESQAILIHDNDIYNMGGDGYQCNKSPVCGYVKFYDNLCHNNGEDCVDLKYAQYHWIYGNRMYRNNGDGLVTKPLPTFRFTAIASMKTAGGGSTLTAARTGRSTTTSSTTMPPIRAPIRRWGRESRAAPPARSTTTPSITTRGRAIRATAPSATTPSFKMARRSTRAATFALIPAVRFPITTSSRPRQG
jgi:hypothetical protein